MTEYIYCQSCGAVTGNDDRCDSCEKETGDSFDHDGGIEWRDVSELSQEEQDELEKYASGEYDR